MTAQTIYGAKEPSPATAALLVEPLQNVRTGGGSDFRRSIRAVIRHHQHAESISRPIDCLHAANHIGNHVLFVVSGDDDVEAQLARGRWQFALRPGENRQQQQVRAGRNRGQSNQEQDSGEQQIH